VRLTGRPWIDGIDRLRRMLQLRREGGGQSGVEYGWRWVHRDASSRVLLQLVFEYPESTEVSLWYSGAAPGPEVVDGLRLQVAAAADRAGLGVAAVIPGPAPDAGTWERLGSPAAGAADLDEVWARLGVDAQTPAELRRGLLLAVIMSSAWAAPAPLLRSQAFEYLLGHPVVGRDLPGLKDTWL
jgi:hypothetical protein